MTDLVLGTAQFGQKYGITNNADTHHDQGELNNILETFTVNGFSIIDTAQGYGESEQMLGMSEKSNLKISTKVNIDEALLNEKDYKEKIRQKLEISLKRLNQTELFRLLIHTPGVMNKFDKKIIKLSRFLKDSLLIKEFGISVYSTSEIRNNMEYIDVVQFPLNFFDRRFANYFRNINTSFKKQARSIFLQGLLISDYGSLPDNFKKHSALRDFHKTLSNKYERLSLSINFVLESDCDEFIVGVSSNKELKQILECFEKKYTKNQESLLAEIFRNFVETDHTKNLIDPRLWTDKS